MTETQDMAYLRKMCIDLITVLHTELECGPHENKESVSMSERTSAGVISGRMRCPSNVNLKVPKLTVSITSTAYAADTSLVLSETASISNYSVTK